MSATKLSDHERAYLLGLARQTIQRAVNGEEIPVIQENDLTPALRAPGASFVTLTKHGDLRGCIGALEAYQPLAYDVREHAAAAALEDYRFTPVNPGEVSSIKIEISRLTPPQKVDYDSPEKLPGILRPGIDGVILKDNFRRATFLPQVWEKLPEPEQFLAHLCQKMGAPSDLWKRKLLQVWVYQVEEFHE